MPYQAPLGRTREIIDICRMAWKREKLVYDGKYYTLPLPPEKGTGLGKPLKFITHPVRDSIPIYVASLGPKNVEMTAELADGWLPLFYIPERAKDVWGDDLAAGFAKRSPELGPLDVVAGGLVAIGEDAAKVAEFARPMVALYVGRHGRQGPQLLQRPGLPLRLRGGGRAEIQDLYLDGKKEEAAAKVPDELLALTNLCGPEGWVKERLAAFKEAGVHPQPHPRRPRRHRRHREDQGLVRVAPNQPTPKPPTPNLGPGRVSGRPEPPQVAQVPGLRDHGSAGPGQVRVETRPRAASASATIWRTRSPAGTSSWMAPAPWPAGQNSRSASMSGAVWSRPRWLAPSFIERMNWAGKGWSSSVCSSQYCV